MQRPLDNDVQMICQNQDRNNMLFNATDALPSQMADAVELAVNRAMQPVTHSMDAFLVGATRAQVDGVSRIVNNFVDQMNASLDHQFLTLGQTLTEINQNQLSGLKRLEDSLSAANTIVHDAMQLHQISQGVTKQFEGYVQSLNEAGRRDAHFEESSAQLLEKLHAAAQQQSGAIASLRTCQDQLAVSLKQFTDTGSSAANSLKKAGDAGAASFSDASRTMQEASRMLSTSYQTFVTDVVEGMSRSLGLFETNMTSVVTALSDQLQSFSLSGASAAQISEMQKLMTSMAASLKSAEKSLSSLAEEG